MVGKLVRRSAILLVVLASVGCGEPEGAEPSAPPQPATEAEMEVFCERYESLRGESWGEMTAGLIEVSPAEIRAEMVRSSEPPGETWAEDREAVEEFVMRCDA